MVQGISTGSVNNVYAPSATAKASVAKSCAKSFDETLEQVNNKTSDLTGASKKSPEEETLEKASSALKKAASGISACKKCGAIYVGASMSICTKCGNDMNKDDDSKTKVDSKSSAAETAKTGAVSATSASGASNSATAGIAGVATAGAAGS